MNSEKQAEATKQFMLAIAPQVAQHKFELLRMQIKRNPLDEETLARLVNAAPGEIAHSTLECAMHLAARWAHCYDEAVYSPPQPEPAPPVQHQKSSPASGLRQSQEEMAH